ncbi:MAG: DUF4209 domain-containing protein [Bacteroidota bacterium]|nr:DUF4209 domain-containing protein [Bacteroidota bacterium]
MNALEQFYCKLDQNGWDVKHESDINQALQKVNESLFEAKLLDVQHLAEIDRQAFHFSKSPEKRLSFRAAGTRTMEDGSEIPFEWPDIREFKKQDFDYLYNRFKTTKNLYSKTEYGLVLFYSKNRQDNGFVIDLLTSLFDLLKTYIEKAKPNDDKDHYIIYSRTVLANALHIANNRREVTGVAVIFKALIKYTFNVHKSWDVTHRSTLRTIIDFTDFAVQYFKDFKETVEVSKFIDKNWEAAKSITNTYVWGAIYITDISIKLSRKLGSDLKDLLYFKAEQYEKLSIERKGDLASVSFVEKAMSIYKSLKDAKNLNRLQQNYQKLRTEFYLGEVRQEMPQDETQRIMELIKKEVKEKSEEEIVKTLLLTPMIRPLDDIKKWSEDSFKETMLQNMLPVSIQDKFGNTVAQYITEEERTKFSLLRTYEFHMQIASQTIIHFFIEAFRSNKISANSIISLLNQTWMGDNGSRQINGRDINFSYIKLVESGINSFFDELLKWKADSNYYPNFVSATDSLVLKTEYFLREFCYFLGIATFKPNPRQQGIIMEKTLDNLLDDLEGKISDNDHFFIKFILTEKAGYNLRNRIAHGLMDNVDYGLLYPILSIIIILKLSNYQFSTVKNN